jgi:hypothetical protein
MWDCALRWCLETPQGEEEPMSGRGKGGQPTQVSCHSFKPGERQDPAQCCPACGPSVAPWCHHQCRELWGPSAGSGTDAHCAACTSVPQSTKLRKLNEGRRASSKVPHSVPDRWIQGHSHLPQATIFRGRGGFIFLKADENTQRVEEARAP